MTKPLSVFADAPKPELYAGDCFDFRIEDLKTKLNFLAFMTCRPSPDCEHVSAICPGPALCRIFSDQIAISAIRRLVSQQSQAMIAPRIAKNAISLLTRSGRRMPARDGVHPLLSNVSQSRGLKTHRCRMQDKEEVFERRTTADMVFDQLYEDIASLKVLPGSKLSEAEIARRFGVSRQPVRDAFNRLGNLDLLLIRPQRATEVRGFSMDRVQHARFVRLAVELEVVHRPAPSGTTPAPASWMPAWISNNK